MPKLHVRSVRKEGFFRAGKFWPSTVTETEVSDEVAAVLLAEPQLVAVLAPEPKPEPKSDSKPKLVKPDPKAE